MVKWGKGAVFILFAGIIFFVSLLTIPKVKASPILNNLELPSNPQSNSSYSVSISTQDTTSVTLFYRIMFENEQSVAMTDDGIGNDVIANDGVFSANIPPQSDGTLIRVRVEANTVDGTVNFPNVDDAMQTRGFVVGATNSSDLPIFRWYIEPSVFDDLVTNHLQDDFYVPAVIALGNQVFDNSKVRVKGESSVHYPKRKYKFKLPKNYEIASPYFDRPVDELALNVYFLNFTDLQEKLAWKSFTKFDFADLPSFYVQVNKNTTSDPSQFYGHYLLTSDYSEDWRIQNGYNTGALYKEANDKKTRKDEDFSDINSLKYNLENLQGEALKNYLLDNLNIPNIINYNAVSAAILSQDWTYYHNIYQYRDSEGTLRWEYVPWDLDNALAFTIFKDSPIANMDLDPINITDSTGEPTFKNDRFIERALFQFPEFRQMYYRRLATVYDQLFKTGELSGWYQNLYNSSQNVISEDINKWAAQKQSLYASVFPDGLPFHFYDDFPFAVNVDDIFSTIATGTQNDQVYRYGMQKYIYTMDAKRLAGEFPAPQSNSPKVKITKIVPASTEGPSYIEFSNPNNIAIDVSGWTLSGEIEFTFKQGSVIPANSFAVITDNDTLFRTSYAGSRLVLGQYNGAPLSEYSELILKNEKGELINAEETNNTIQTPITNNSSESNTLNNKYIRNFSVSDIFHNTQNNNADSYSTGVNEYNQPRYPKNTKQDNTTPQNTQSKILQKVLFAVISFGSVVIFIKITLLNQSTNV